MDVRPLSATAPAPPADLEAALRSRRYCMLAPIARGAFGEVWLAVLEGDAGFRIPCAIKVFRPRSDDPELLELSRELFIKEARILAGLRHDHILRVTDFFASGPYLCLVMEYVEGLVLSTVLSWRRSCRKPPLPMGVALAIVAQAARGLHHAHTSRDRLGQPLHLLHQDIKPSNLILSTGGRLQLLDFGVASMRREGEADYVLGTPQYMSPEQARGQAAGPAADLYSLGLVLYALLTLQPLIPADDPVVAQRQAIELEPEPSIAELDARHPPAAGLLRWMLARAPEARPRDGLMLARAIDEILDREPGRPDLARFCQHELAQIQLEAPGLLGPSLEVCLAALPVTGMVRAGCAEQHAENVDDLELEIEPFPTPARAFPSTISSILAGVRLPSRLMLATTAGLLVAAWWGLARPEAPIGDQGPRAEVSSALGERVPSSPRPGPLAPEVVSLEPFVSAPVPPEPSDPGNTSLEPSVAVKDPPRQDTDTRRDTTSQDEDTRRDTASQDEDTRRDTTSQDEDTRRDTTKPGRAPQLERNNRGEKRLAASRSGREPVEAQPAVARQSVRAGRAGLDCDPRLVTSATVLDVSRPGTLKVLIRPRPEPLELLCGQRRIDITGAPFGIYHLAPGVYRVRGRSDGQDFSLEVRIEAGRTCGVHSRTVSDCPP